MRILVVMKVSCDPQKRLDRIYSLVHKNYKISTKTAGMKKGMITQDCLVQLGLSLHKTRNYGKADE